MDPQTAVKDKNFSPGRDPSFRDGNSSMGRGFFHSGSESSVWNEINWSGMRVQARTEIHL